MGRAEERSLGSVDVKRRHSGTSRDSFPNCMLEVGAEI